MGNVTYPQINTSTNTVQTPGVDWQVLVLFADDTERDIKGIWGPYTSMAVATDALAELKQWPLDGYWDVRRLNKFVARKSGNEPDQLVRWTWA
jgi:hypothetical protein